MPATLTDIIRQKIQADGPMTLAEYMQMSLFHPQLGYYVTRDPLGAEGDFTTAPEMTQVFGELIGLWCVEVWKSLGRPQPFALCELGPGRGTLMADALRAARVEPAFIESVKVHLIEASPALRKKQAALLSAYAPVWLDTLEQLPDMPVITLANEFFDALPIRQFMRIKDRWMERKVGVLASGAFSFVLAPTTDAPDYDLPEDTIVEVCPDAHEWASRIARPIVKNRGAALILDYGDDEIIGETLQAVSGHRQAHALSTPGFADITAHVSFEPLGRAMRKIGCRIHGPLEQGPFLMALGARERTEALCRAATPDQVRTLEAALHRLTDFSAMGKLFKVMAATDRNLAPPPGF